MVERPILVVTAHYAPENAIGALRVTALARLLAEAGWRVTVATRHSQPGPPDPGVTTVEVSDRVADWRRRRLTTRGGRLRRAVRRIASGVSFRLSWPDEQVWWSMSVWRRLRRGMPQVRVVLVSGPPFSTFLVGYLVARRTGAHLVLDYRDLWTRSTYYEGSVLRRWFDAGVERVVLRRASVVATVSQPLADDMARWSSTPVVVAQNGFDPGDYERFDQRPASPSGPLRLVYVGELYAGKRDPAPLFETLSEHPDLRSEVSVEFYGSNVLALGPTVERYGLQECVQLSSRVSHGEALGLQEAADVLLLLLWNDPREAGVYSGKLFEYLGARRTVLMLGYPDGVAAELVRSRGAGVVANTPQEIAAALRDLLARKRSGELTRSPARSAAGLSREEQFGPLLDYVGSLAESTSARHSRTNRP